jgi:hypothetical protein
MPHLSSVIQKGIQEAQLQLEREQSIVEQLPIVGPMLNSVFTTLMSAAGAEEEDVPPVQHSFQLA